MILGEIYKLVSGEDKLPDENFDKAKFHKLIISPKQKQVQ